MNDIISRFLSTCSKIKLLSHDETVALAKLRDAGDPDARNKIVVGHMRLVWFEMKKRGFSNYTDRRIQEDLISWGLEGLIETADRWEWQRGFTFSTYARHWIFQKMNTGLNTGRTEMSMPWTAHEATSDSSKSHRLKKPEYVEAAKRARDNRNFVSLNKEFGNASGKMNKTIGELIPDPDGAALFDAADNENEAAWLWGLVDKVCTSRERTVIRMRYIDGATLGTCANAIGRTRERARQIIAAGVDRLRSEISRDLPKGPFNWSKIGGKVVDSGVKIGDIVVRRYPRLPADIGEVVDWSRFSARPKAIVRLGDGSTRSFEPHLLEVLDAKIS